MATLEQFASDLNPQDGTGASPEAINEIVTTLRQTHPGQSDDQIIAAFQASQGPTTSPVAPQSAVTPQALPTMTPTGINARGGYAPGPADNGVAITPKPALPNNVNAATTPMGRADMYRQANDLINTQYGASAQQEAVDKGRKNNLFNDAARSANLGLRAMGTAQGNAVLDQDYKEQSAKANQPVQDFQAAKAQAQAELESKLRAGDIDAADAKNQMNALGLKIAQEEYASKKSYTAANNDPGSATTAAKRMMAKSMAPDLAKSVDFDKMTGVQIDGYLPTVEKAYLKKLEQEGKLAIQNAKSSGAGGVKTSDQIKVVMGEQKIDADVEKSRAALAETNHSIDLINEMVPLLKTVNTGDIQGRIAQALPGAVQSKERQRLNQITAELTNSLLNAAKGAQTDKDRAALEVITSQLGQDDPAPGIMSAQKWLKDQAERHAASIAEGEGRKAKLQAIGGGTNPMAPAPAKASGTPTVRDQAGYDALPAGATYMGPDGKVYRKKG